MASLAGLKRDWATEQRHNFLEKEAAAVEIILDCANLAQYRHIRYAVDRDAEFVDGKGLWIANNDFTMKLHARYYKVLLWVEAPAIFELNALGLLETLGDLAS